MKSGKLMTKMIILTNDVFLTEENVLFPHPRPANLSPGWKMNV